MYDLHPAKKVHLCKLDLEGGYGKVYTEMSVVTFFWWKSQVYMFFPTHLGFLITHLDL